MEIYLIPFYLIVFLYGIVIGSFLNVCIYRIPRGESLSKKRSHCMSCGYRLAWFDLIPLFSWLALRGKCRKCGAPISPQYPIVEGFNGVLYVLIFAVNGFNVRSVLYCLMGSALIALSVIDFRTYEIHDGFHVFILVLGAVNLVLDFQNRKSYLLGAVIVFIPLYILYVVSKGTAIGGGDVKLMGACGFLIGRKLIVLAFFMGCIIGSVIHLIRMKIRGEGRVLAMGPYLSAGIMLSTLFGNQMIEWYIGLL